MKPYGIDVSHHQAPASLPWARIAETSSFCMARGSYGLMRDRATVDHVRHARSVGLRVGLYHFFRISQSLPDQLAVFRQQLTAAGITVGDVLPAIDVELDPFPTPTPVAKGWAEPVKAFVDAMVGEFGDCLVYITQLDFANLGRPDWLLDRPLWVAHYTGAAKPATPANHAWTIWQHRVGPYNPDAAGGYDKARPELDQNRLAGDLPLIRGHVVEPRSTVPPDDGAHDDGLEELLDQLHASSWERAQDAVGMAGANLREHDGVEERGLAGDTDPSDLAPESEGGRA